MNVPLLGREVELEAADRFLTMISAGSAALIVEGEPGIGKTAVWREVLARADASSCRVLACGAAELEAQLAYASLGDLLAGVEEDAFTSVPAPQRRALEVALLRADASGGVLDPRAVYMAVVSLLSTLARASPLVVAIDDVQWLDRASAHSLVFAVRRILNERVGFVLTVRTGCEAAVVREFERSLGEQRLVRRRVGPLGVGALHELVRTRLGLSLRRPMLLHVHRVTRGNPLFALELAGALVREGVPGPGEPLPVPDDLRELIRRRMDALPGATRQLLFVATAMPDPTLDALRRAVKISHRQALRQLAPAQAAGVVDVKDEHIRFTHPLFASAVYAALPAAQRRGWHRRLALLATDVEQRARHLALGADGPGKPVADALETAAHAARARGAPEDAAELAELAIALSPPDGCEDLHRRRLQAADHSLRAGDFARVRSLLDQVLAEVSGGSTRARVLLLLGELRHQEDSVSMSLALLTQAMQHVGDEALLAAQVGVQLAMMRYTVGDLLGAETAARTAVKDADRANVPAVLAQGLAVLGICRFLRGGGADWEMFARAQALEDPNGAIVGMLRPSTIAAIMAVYTGQIDSARTQLEAVRRRVIERGEESDLPFVSLHLAWVECLMGDLPCAERYAREACESAVQIVSATLRIFALMAVGLVAAHRGEANAARSALNEILALCGHAGWRPTPLWALSILGFLELSLGDLQAAHRALEPLAQATEAEGLDEATRPFFLPEAIEALIGVGQLDRAEHLIGVLKEGRHCDRPCPMVTAGRCHALLLAARGDLKGALHTLQHALDHDQAAPMPLERGRTLLALGVVQRRSGQRRNATDTLRHALKIFDDLGAPLWAQRTHSELRRLGGRPTTGALTPSEEHVA
jgi:tetratricopeptide (TPR) repeat protein